MVEIIVQGAGSIGMKVKKEKKNIVYSHILRMVSCNRIVLEW